MYYIFNFLLIAGMCILYIYCPTGKLRNFKKFSLQFSHGKIILGGGIDIAGFLFFGQIIVPVIDHSGIDMQGKKWHEWRRVWSCLHKYPIIQILNDWKNLAGLSISFFLSLKDKFWALLDAAARAAHTIFTYTVLCTWKSLKSREMSKSGGAGSMDRAL